jgi:hypothetical protein
MQNWSLSLIERRVHKKAWRTLLLLNRKEHTPFAAFLACYNKIQLYITILPLVVPTLALGLEGRCLVFRKYVHFKFQQSMLL